jgi:1-acyl-sn-glycerol-3-phosphate acyltransferase
MARTFRFVVSLLHTGYEYVAMLLGLGALAFVSLWGLPVALLLLCAPIGLRVRLGRQLISRSLAGYLQLLRLLCAVRLDDAALKTLRTHKSLIVIANHPSLLDAVILLANLPDTACVMKASLQSNLFFGPMARLSGYISNQDPKQLIHSACDALQSGSHVLIFPESTRTVTPPVNPFGQTCALIAARSGMPVQTVFIEFSTNYLGKTWPLFRKPTLPLRINVRLGQQFDASKDRFGLTETLESYYREHLTHK